MRHQGRIHNWNDDKGFGFVTPYDGSQRAFVHIKAFQMASRRPVEGDLISYETASDTKGRLNATSVRFAGQRTPASAALPARKARPGKLPRRIPRVGIGAGFLLAVVILMMTGKMPAVLALVYLLMSGSSYLMYALDKEVAGMSRWRRTPESTLHLLDLLGGWPGGLIAQQVTRHKTAKASFQGTVWVTVVTNLVLFAFLWRSGVAGTWTAWVLG